MKQHISETVGAIAILIVSLAVIAGIVYNADQSRALRQVCIERGGTIEYIERSNRWSCEQAVR